jgi:hypothetical protein
MSKNHVCGICGKDKSHYVMNNKRVCLRCDELLFDIEIECEEMAQTASKDGTQTAVTKTIRVADKKAAR